jgi:arylsulfatase A-like enzyme
MARLTVLSVVMAIIAIAGCGPTEKQIEPPNVVLITIDALRSDFLSYAGHPNRTSPNLDSLARKGVVFSQALTSYPGTSPAMPSLMTGLFPSFENVDEWVKTTRHGFNEFESPKEKNRRALSSNLRMLAEILKDHGYTTVGFNTNPNLSAHANFDQGFDFFEEFKKHNRRQRRNRDQRMIGAYPPARVVMNRVLESMNDTVHGPVFFWIHFMDPHSPYLPPERIARRFPRTYSQRSDLEINEALYHILHSQRGATTKAAQFRSPEDLGIDHETLNDHARGLYEAEIRYCDTQLRRLFTRLEEDPGWRNTLVIVTADHGEEFFEHGFVTHHVLSSLAEELIRIPLIIKLPTGVPSGVTVDALVRLVDIAPTILDYAGLETESSDMDGTSLRSLIDGQEEADRIAFYSTIDLGIVRTAKWKYRRFKRPDSSGGRREVLFDIVADPMEEHNVAARHPEVLSELSLRYDAFAQRLRTRATPKGTDEIESLGELDADELERLEALGYVSDR